MATSRLRVMASFGPKAEKEILRLSKVYDVSPSMLVRICVQQYLPIMAALDKAGALKVLKDE